ncbi:Uncharacterized protein dnm_090490 [Desulfonema magnum]|uniref:Uncharacterized protein n=1 Tax=Desulfonema magnum TaxID=45655 RepID=A0A975BWB4_9BACT|nr:Uncharacterized protein dnm_090490 [Desulfonema magnum]
MTGRTGQKPGFFPQGECSVREKKPGFFAEKKVFGPSQGRRGRRGRNPAFSRRESAPSGKKSRVSLQKKKFSGRHKADGADGAETRLFPAGRALNVSG